MSDSTPLRAAHQRLPALLIGGTALLEVVLVTHHPVAPRGGEGGVPFGGIQAVMDANLGFHALLMVILAGQLLGLVLFARLLGLNRPIVLVGLVFCTLAGVMLTVAMTFDGFVTYELISACAASAEGCTPATGQSLRLISAAIQSFTKLGFGAQCLGFAALGFGLWGIGGRIRLAAVACVALALSPIVLIVLGGRVGPSQLTQILVVLAAWGLCVAVTIGLRSLRERGSSTV